MTEPKTTSIRIEPLNPTHLAQWVQDAPIDQLSRFQAFLIGEWLSRVEQRFPDLLHSRSPRCLMALVGDRPVASVVARPGIANAQKNTTLSVRPFVFFYDFEFVLQYSPNGNHIFVSRMRALITEHINFKCDINNLHQFIKKHKVL